MVEVNLKNCDFHYAEHCCTDKKLINAFIDMFPLALITTFTNNTFHSSHIPLLRNTDGTLFGHVDKHNPQFIGINTTASKIVFTGPSSYIPPMAYSGPQLPTWNYLAVHVQANIEVIESEIRKLEILTQSALRFAPDGCDYHVEPNDPRVIKNLPHILGITVQPICLEGRFKLSKDKPLADHLSALEWLLKEQKYECNKLSALSSFIRKL